MHITLSLTVVLHQATVDMVPRLVLVDLSMEVISTP